jgi:hypothetical protein
MPVTLGAGAPGIGGNPRGVFGVWLRRNERASYCALKTEGGNGQFVLDMIQAIQLVGIFKLAWICAKHQTRPRSDCC